MVTFDTSSVSGDTQCVNVMVIGDENYEADETVMLYLNVTRTGQAGSVSSTTLTITNDDGK